MGLKAFHFLFHPVRQEKTKMIESSFFLSVKLDPSPRYLIWVRKMMNSLFPYCIIVSSSKRDAFLRDSIIFCSFSSVKGFYRNYASDMQLYGIHRSTDNILSWMTQYRARYASFHPLSETFLAIYGIAPIKFDSFNRIAFLSVAFWYATRKTIGEDFPWKLDIAQSWYPVLEHKGGSEEWKEGEKEEIERRKWRHSSSKSMLVGKVGSGH